MVVKISKNSIRNIIKEVSPDVRISASALLRLQDIATDFIRMTVTDSFKLAQHTKRKTILERDVILATE